MEKFKERLRNLRIEKKLSLNEVAEQTGLSKSAISFWETGERVPNAQAVIILADFYGVSTDYLLGIKDW